MGTLLRRGLLVVALLLTFIFPAWAQDGKGIGVVTALTGRADLKRPQAPETPLKLRDNLFVRDVVDTQKESLARILLMGKSTVTVRELSRFEIREETRPDGSQRSLINLAEGKIRVMVARRLMRPGDEVEIRTPNAIAAVRGSDGIIEVSKLPDGRPQTVITGVSGEFQLTLPTTPPFIANGKEFQDGPALAGGAPGVLIAMAETASDAGSGLQLAQLPTGLNVTALLQAQITGAAGAQTSRFAQLTLQQVIGIGANVQLKVAPPPPPPTATDRAVNTGIAFATTATLASGAQPGLGRVTPAGSGGGGGSIIQQPVYQPNQFVPKPSTPTFQDLRISVLVYDCPSCANTINGLTGSGPIFRAVNVSSTEFATMTAAQINGFRVLAIPSTDELTTGVAGLLNNANVGTAVNGNQVITGLHTAHNKGQRDQFVINALQFAAQAGAGKTGLAAATDGCNAAGCAGGKAGAMWIDQSTSFLKNAFNGTAITRNLNENAVQVTNAGHVVNSGSGLTGGQPLTNAGLSNWNNSVHSTFSSTPAGYQVIQTVAVGDGQQKLTLVKTAP